MLKPKCLSRIVYEPTTLVTGIEGFPELNTNNPVNTERTYVDQYQSPHFTVRTELKKFLPDHYNFNIPRHFTLGTSRSIVKPFFLTTKDTIKPILTEHTII